MDMFGGCQSGSSRREFLKGKAWILGLAAVSGCMVDRISPRGAPATNFSVSAMPKIRVGYICFGKRQPDFFTKVYSSALS